MRPRNPADYRSMAWVGIAAALGAAQVASPSLVPYLWWVSAYFALACGVMAHNHNHCPTFSSRRANSVYAALLSIFYGYPTFAWIPTHNLNHHKFVNAPGDATITWRYTNSHNALVAATYFFVSAYFQSGPINEFIRKARASNPEVFRRILVQYAVWGGSHVALFSLAVALHGFSTGAYVWIFAFGLPGFFALWTIMLFNYEQHVHCDPYSDDAHSRSFTSRTLNFLLFNNGLHFVHHENPGAHWSRLPAFHAATVDKIHPSLVLRSVWWYWLRQYVLALFVPSLGTVQLGSSPWSRGASTIATAEVGVGEAGSNAERLRHAAAE